MSLEEVLSGGGESTGTELTNISSSLSDMMAPFVWLSVALTVLLVVLYAFSVFRRRKLENALFDIQKTLHELNERDKARSLPAPTPDRSRPAPEKDRIIAASDNTDDTA